MGIVLGNDEPGSIAKGGVICGWIGLAIYGLGLIAFLLLLLLGAFSTAAFSAG